MPTRKEFAQYLQDQLSLAGNIRCRPLMGEYGLWCDGIFFGTIENDCLYLKITPAARRLLPDAPVEEPHPGAKFLAVRETDDREFLARLVRETCAELPPPKPRRKQIP